MKLMTIFVFINSTLTIIRPSFKLIKYSKITK